MVVLQIPILQNPATHSASQTLPVPVPVGLQYRLHGVYLENNWYIRTDTSFDRKIYMYIGSTKRS